MNMSSCDMKIPQSQKCITEGYFTNMILAYYVCGYECAEITMYISVALRITISANHAPYKQVLPDKSGLQLKIQEWTSPPIKQ